MAVLCKLFRFTRGFTVIERNVYQPSRNCLSRNARNESRGMCTIIQEKPYKGIFKSTIIGAGVGLILGLGYVYYKKNEIQNNYLLEGTQQESKILKYKPSIVPSRKVISPFDSTGLQLTLFQYQTCPFCCKVRVLLDYYGLSYDVVEVDPVLRKEINWSDYKKVPILLMKVENGYQQLNDSSMIISFLTSYLTEKSHDIKDLVSYYPSIFMRDNDGKVKPEYMNKYYLIQQNTIPTGDSLNEITEERKWRQWADNVLVHMLSPNVYRTLDEAYETFHWFSEVGKWEEYFPTWERMIMINVGACAMWLISKRLTKKHNLKEDTRQSLYDTVNQWLKQIKAQGTPFMGGQKPNLSDLAVYGILKSIEGCTAFKDLRENTKISGWYNAMSEKIEQHAGKDILHI